MADALPEWPARRFEAAAARSVTLHGNRYVLPVAAWILDSGADDVTAPEVFRGLSGQVVPNKALEALSRICEIGALEELPHLGRPFPRRFHKRPSAYWTFVAELFDSFDLEPEAGTQRG
jgi:hypothetical protein